jgi:hypothetical protein
MPGAAEATGGKVYPFPDRLPWSRPKAGDDAAFILRLRRCRALNQRLSAKTGAEIETEGGLENEKTNGRLAESSRTGWMGGSTFRCS